jgi:hypothetical protein
MSNIDNIDFDDENAPSSEEEKNISTMEVVSYATKDPELEKLLSIPTVGDFVPTSRAMIDFDLFRRIGMAKVVKINNISGKNAWVMLSPAPIMKIGSFKLDKVGQISFVSSGNHKTQQISIPNGSRSEYDLDNSMTNVSLFLHIDGKWKKVWIDRLFNTRKYDINILEKHIAAAIDHEFN